MPGQDTYVALPNGSYVHVPADATPEQLSALRTKLGSNQQSPSFGADALSKATAIGPRPSNGPVIDTIDKAREWLENKVTTGSQAGAGEFMASAPLGVLRTAKGAVEQFTPGKNWQGIKDIVGGGQQALTMPGMVMAPEAAETAAGAIPSTARAGKKFEEVMQAARTTPIKSGEPTIEAMRGKEIASRGGQLPKILRDFVRRTSDPKAPPITYEEARDFYTNARLAMSEYLQTKPNMWRQVTIFKNALGNAISDAAHEAGKGSEYLSAMTEYRRAKRMQDLAQAAAKIGIPLAIGYQANKAIGALTKAGE